MDSKTVSAWLRSNFWIWPALLVLLGVGEHILWIFQHGGWDHASGEAPNIAISLAENGTYADAFRAGSGPTAHMLPFAAGIAGAVYALFGVHSGTSESILTVLALEAAFGAFLLLYRAFGILGVNRFWRLAALALLCLFPINIALESVSFRVWEGAYAALSLAIGLNLILHVHRTAVITNRDIVLLAAVAALAFFIHPPVGLAIYLACGLVMLQRVSPARWPIAIVSAVLALAILLVPWMLRNNAALGKPILLRDNFGLELSLAFYPGAAGADRQKLFVDRLNEIHPYASDNAYSAFVKAGKEPHYPEMLGKGTTAWIKANPGESLHIALTNFRELLFPPSWKWSIFGTSSSGTSLKLAVTWIVTALGLLMALGAAFFKRAAYLYVAIFAIVPLLPYVLTNPILRYKYPVWALLVFLSAALMQWAFDALLARRKAVAT